jgi:hypothetical protein
MTKPAFLITIDTEGDNLWQAPFPITTKNSLFLARFQQLCEKYQFKPTWLTNYEMAMDSRYIEFAKDVIARNQGEIGMHLHAWHSPPEAAITDNDYLYQPYLIEYPDSILLDKVKFMTDLLEQKLQVKMRSHRAGRWAFDERYAAALRKFDYWVDCSVTPLVNWQATFGAPNGQGGTDYRHFPQQAYFMDVADIAKVGDSQLLQVPMSTRYRHGPVLNCLKQQFARLKGKVRPPAISWLRPGRNNLSEMQKVVSEHLANGADYVEFMLHSSEFMPAGSPTFRNSAEIERLYANLEQLFLWLSTRTQGMTLSEYYLTKRPDAES